MCIIYILVVIQERDRSVIIQSMKEGTFDGKSYYIKHLYIYFQNRDRFMIVATEIETDFYNNVKKNDSDAAKDVLAKAWNGKHDELYSVKLHTNYIADKDMDLMSTVRSMDDSTVRNDSTVNSMELLEIREKYDKLVNWTTELITQKDELSKRCEQLEEELRHAKNEYQTMRGENDNRENNENRNKNEFNDINLQPDTAKGYSLFALIFGIIMSFLIGIGINRSLKL